MRKNLFCHIMHDMINEVGRVKCKLYAQEFKWKKRMWAIPTDALAWRDNKGNEHLFFDVNETDGVIRFMLPDKMNYDKIDKCVKCGDRISIDAKNTYDLLKRKTVSAIWGVDQTYVMLLIIMAIIALIAVAGIMYLLGENRKMQDTITKYLQNPPKPIIIKEDGTQVPQLIIPYIGDN